MWVSYHASISRFSWENNVANNIYVVVAVPVFYVGLILLNQISKQVRDAISFPNSRVIANLAISHNVILCVGSLFMLLGCCYEVVQRFRLDGLTWLFCEIPGTKSAGSLYFYSYLYHLSKYYELVDTWLQLLSGKTPPNFFLHVYHHASMIVITWMWLETAGSLQFVGILFNCAVHVVMYYYYFLKSIGITPKWKNWVTKFQIVQFVFSIVAFCVTVYLNWSQPYGVGVQCRGLESVMVTIGFNITLLYGFVSILRKNSKSSSSRLKSK